jgi:predicted site-specific integrase-resolvase
MGDIELMTPEAVCKALAISPTTLWRLSKSGQLVPLRILSSPRYTSAQLEAYISRQQKISKEVWLSD